MNAQSFASHRRPLVAWLLQRRAAAWLAVLQQDPEAAGEAAARAMEITEKHVFPRWVSTPGLPPGWVQAAQGDPERGLAVIEDGLAALHASE